MFDFKTEEGLVKWGNVAKSITAILVLILMIGSGVMWVNSYFAHATDVANLELAMNSNVNAIQIQLLKNQKTQLQSNIWNIEDQIVAKGETPVLKHKLRILEAQMEEVKDQLKKLEK
jgi:hypothetical protein